MSSLTWELRGGPPLLVTRPPHEQFSWRQAATYLLGVSYVGLSPFRQVTMVLFELQSLAARHVDDPLRLLLFLKMSLIGSSVIALFRADTHLECMTDIISISISKLKSYSSLHFRNLQHHHANCCRSPSFQQDMGNRWRVASCCPCRLRTIRHIRAMGHDMQRNLLGAYMLFN